MSYDVKGSHINYMYLFYHYYYFDYLIAALYYCYAPQLYHEKSRFWE